MVALPHHAFSFAPFPALRIALLFAAGVTCAREAGGEPVTWMLLFGTALAAYLTLEQQHRRHPGRGSLLRSLIVYSLLLFLAGGARHALHEATLDRSSPARMLASHSWETAEVSGILLQVSTSSTGRRHLELRIDRTLLSGGISWQQTYGLRAVMDSARYARLAPLRPGSRLRLRVTVWPSLEGPRNPHQFDYRGWLRSRGITVQAGADSLLSLESPSGWSWPRLRGEALEQVDRIFSRPTAPLAKALLLGYKQELDPSDRRDFSRVGLSHIMAVSGLHVGFLLAPFWWMLPWLRTFRHGPAAGMVLTVLLLGCYAGLTGFTASVTRATLTGGLLVYARLYHRIHNPVNLTAASALIILAADPSQLATPGFQLSYGAVFAILLCLPVLRGLLPARHRYRAAGRIFATSAISVLVPLALYPLLASYFGEISLAAPLSNLLAMPLLIAVVPTSLLWLALSTAAPKAGTLLNMPNDYALASIAQGAEWLAAVEGSWMRTPEPGVLLTAAWIFVLLLLSSLRHPRLRWKLTAVCLAAACLGQARGLQRSASVPPLTVIFFDVGQGDAALVRTPAGRNLLFDAGPGEEGYSSARYVLLPYLRATGVDTLHAVLLSHPHADHLGGMPDLLESLPVGVVYHPGQRHDSGLYRRYRETARRLDVPLQALAAGDRLRPDPALRLQVLGPRQTVTDSLSREAPMEVNASNEGSLVIRLVYGETSILFMGDAETPSELELIRRYGGMLQSDLLKAGHHGAADATSSPFLRAVRPEKAVVSAGVRNPFGHPHPATLERLRSADVQTWITARDQALIFRSNGQTIRRVAWR
ncbi:MAG: DNA internalization-related competence protein ComEC/Rec2 [Balneolaceae bacterium]|nr:DNA internalization-related competence protein ComEC/Rec2 [Balneolaceae bacterium]